MLQVVKTTRNNQLRHHAVNFVAKVTTTRPVGTMSIAKLLNLDAVYYQLLAQTCTNKAINIYTTYTYVC